MRGLLGAEAGQLITALGQPPVVGLRINTSKADPTKLTDALPWAAQPVPWCPAGFVLPDPPARPGRHPWHAAGVFYLQDPSAMAVAEAVDIAPGMWVADLAAAPGGKATRLSERAGPTGFLLANDVQPDRALALGQNLERWGAGNTVLVRAEVAELASAWGDVFDVVLLDAPCSGEGMFRKSPDARTMWSEATVDACAARQDALLDEAARMVAPGGAMVYSTCTFAPEENEEIVAGFLAQHPSFEIEPITLTGLATGRADWAGSEALSSLTGTARLWPHRHAGEGHFLAVLRHRPSGGVAAGRSADRTRHFAPARDDLEAAAAELLEAFAVDALATRPWAGRALVQRGDQIYARPTGTPDLTAGNLIRPGLWLGTVKTKRFEPSHALALALTADQAVQKIDLVMEDPELAAYLTGLELSSEGDDGWLLVCVDGYPLGWGRRVRGVVRNAYPKGLRLR